ncbi:hypothetical protein CYMTET_44777 [Cymbomonas tetramitiformis]|uniref:Uncharacterized protein n=1 Tax=Cymbomonas tetramitiformis TaxID=36881 RepID=A0AAE0C1E2_9CHLO|nr:hypothetical protein CYMTET_44777 [Cymbomonas tetramitiformis]
MSQDPRETEAPSSLQVDAQRRRVGWGTASTPVVDDRRRLLPAEASAGQGRAWRPGFGRRAPARLCGPPEPRLAPAAAAPLQLYLRCSRLYAGPRCVEAPLATVPCITPGHGKRGCRLWEEVHAMALRRIGAQGAATAEVYASLVDSLSQAFAFSVSFPPASWSGDTSLSFFPMIPDLHLVAGTAGASGQQIANINFSTFNLVDKNYTEMVAQYFDTTATSRVGTNAAEEVPVSLATLLFIDFFSCLAQTSLNHVYSFMRTNGYNPDDASRTHTLQDILKEISATDGAWMSVAGSVSASFRSGTRLPTHLPGDPQLQKQPLQAYLPHGKHGKPQARRKQWQETAAAMEDRLKEDSAKQMRLRSRLTEMMEQNAQMWEQQFKAMQTELEGSAIS